MNDYTCIELTSFLYVGIMSDLILLYAGDTVLFYQYAYIQVNPARWPHVQASLAMALEAWLTSDTSKGLIDAYTINGEHLFTFNATRP